MKSSALRAVEPFASNTIGHILPLFHQFVVGGLTLMTFVLYLLSRAQSTGITHLWKGQSNGKLILYALANS